MSAQYRPINVRRKYGLSFLAVFAVSSLIQLSMLFYAGRVGDTKAALHGDPERACHIETLALMLIIPASVFSGAGIYFLLQKSLIVRTLSAFFITFFSLAVLYALGWIVGDCGVMSVQ